MWRASLATLEGRFSAAQLLIEETAAIGREAQDENAELYAEIQEFAIGMTRGPLPAPEIAPLDRETGRPAEYAYRSGSSWVLAAAGRAREASAHLDWILGDGGARLADDMNRLAALYEMSEAIRRLGGHPHAAAVYERLAPYADRNVVNGRAASGYGSAARALGLLAAALGDAPRAIGHLEQALEHNAALGARPWLARTRADLARLLDERDPARAAELRRAAAAEARAIGLAPE
jgi:tetratricopeptide (TPR) repeat protein